MKRLSIFGCVLAAGLMITACDDSSNNDANNSDTKEHICEHFKGDANALDKNMLLTEMHKAYKVTVETGTTTQSLEEANAEGNKKTPTADNDKGKNESAGNSEGDQEESSQPNKDPEKGSVEPETNPPKDNNPNKDTGSDDSAKNQGNENNSGDTTSTENQNPDAKSPTAPMVKVKVAKAGNVVLAVKDGSIEKVMMEGKEIKPTSKAKEAEGCKEVKKSEYKIDKGGDLEVTLKADAGKKSVIIAYETVEKKAEGQDAKTSTEKQ